MRIVPREGKAQVELSSTLEERYELVREIGRGATALVYLARERTSGVLVAIKAIRGEFAQDPEVAARFEREARTAAALDHANIVRIYAVARLAGRALAIVMQYVPGGTLRELLRTRGPLGFAEAERVLRDVAAALAYAHARGVVHRDVKPENIFLEEGTGRALLSDFGIARSLELDHQLTMDGSAIGTPTYMSPEQIDGLTVDGRSDLYSLGLVGWEMLAGQRPWDGDTLYNVIYKQKHQRLPRLDELRPGIPPNLLFSIEGALLKRREDRWASADEFLERLSSDQPGSRPTPSAPLAVVTPSDTPTVVFRRPGPADTLAGAPGAGSAPDGEARGSAPTGTPGVPAPMPVAVVEPARAGLVTHGAPPRRRSRLPLFVWIGLPLLFALGLALAKIRDDRRAGRAVVRPARPDSAAVATTSAGVLTGDSGPRAITREPEGVRPTGGVDSALGDSVFSADTSLVVATSSEPTPARETTAAPEVLTEVRPRATTAARTVPAPGGALRGDVARRCSSSAAADQRACLTARLEEHDRELNRVYGQLIAGLRRRARARAGAADPPEVARLRVEQRAWINQRDIECRRQGRGREGALWAPVRAACLGEIADYRVAELRTRLRGL